VRVLIADDNRDAVMTLGILLRSEGHEVWSVQAGAEVAKAVREFKPELVLLDLGMPDRSGYAVAQQLCREYGPNCPILIAVTGQTSSAAKEMAEVSGFHRFIAKPYDAEDLLGFVRQVERDSAARARCL
jgi:CheY-like chemotaxis protein